MYQISKSFNFCYGHRVYSQDPDERLSLSSECPCHRLHGHQGKVTVYLQAEELDHRDFVLDFKELAFVKRFIDENLDHRFILSTQDPFFSTLTGMSLTDFTFVRQPIFLHPELQTHDIMGWKFSLNEIETNPLLESFFVVAFNPTSENLAQWIFKGVREVFKRATIHNCGVQKVVWSETPKTEAVYANSY